MRSGPAGDGPRLPPMPRPAFRVGVTGARDLDRRPADVQATIRGHVEAALCLVREEAVAGTWLRLLSPLAEGADRLVALLARDLGYEVEILLPFARADYARDFATPESRAAFDRWFEPDRQGRAPQPLALDGARGDHEAASYEAVGRLVVRNCDLLLAVWDGRPARGRGGTAEIVRFALRFGVPVWWIDADGAAAPRFASTPSDLRLPAPPERSEAHLRLALRCAGAPARHRRAAGPMASLVDRAIGASVDPLALFSSGTLPREKASWLIQGAVHRILGGPVAAHRDAAPPAAPEAAAYWDAFHDLSDAFSTRYADRYRSSYLWVALLATAATACAVLGLAVPSAKVAATACELVLLAGIAATVAGAARHDWRGRWIGFRLLAELCRKQGALAVLGWSLPPMSLQRGLDGIDGDGIDGDGDAAAWIPRVFDAARRAAPLPAGELRGAVLERARDHARAALVAGQRRYHAERRARSRRAGGRLALWGRLAFLSTLVLVAAKLAVLMLLGTGEVHALLATMGAAAAILPALSAAFFAVRAFAEFDLLERQSARMESLMGEADRQLERLDLSRPLASQDLGVELLDVSAAMLQELAGWAELFRIKVVEAG